MNIKGYFNESCNICRTEINHYKKINSSSKILDNYVNVLKKGYEY